MAVLQNNGEAYGISDALLPVFPQPARALRAPTTTDRAQIGQVWIDIPANTVYILTSITGGNSNWQLIAESGGAGVFATLHVTGTSALDGLVTLGSGGLTGVNSNITLTGTGAISTVNGNISTTGTGSISSHTTLLAHDGDITATLGDIVATDGDIFAFDPLSNGNGNINAAGELSAGTAVAIVAAGDPGSGDTGNLTLTGVVGTSVGTGTLTVLTSSGSGTSGTSAGFIKAYSNAGTAIFIPYFISTV